MDSAAELLTRLERSVEVLNATTKELLGTGRFLFRPTSLPLPRLRPAALGFYLSVEWLHELYYEAGRPGVGFLGGLVEGFGVESRAKIYSLLYDLHDWQIAREPKLGTEQKVKVWFRAVCGREEPIKAKDWDASLRVLLSEALVFQGTLQEALALIAQDESCPEVCKDWLSQLERVPTPEACDVLIAEISSDFGLASLDVSSFRRLHYPVWIHRLQRLRSDHDARGMARQLIEQSLTSEVRQALPITSQDLLTEFSLLPGPWIPKLLERARRLYEDEPCDGKTLLSMLEPWARKLKPKQPGKSLSLREEALRYASPAVLLDRVGRKDKVAEGILQRLLREPAFSVAMEALKKNRKGAGAQVLFLYLVACFLKSPGRPLQLQGFLGEHPRWGRVGELRKVVIHLEKSLARGFELSMSEQFVRQHFQGELSEEQGASILLTLSSELRRLLYGRLVREECFEGEMEVLLVSRHGEELGSVSLGPVAGEWAFVGRWDPEGQSPPDVPLREIPTELPERLFRIRYGDGGYRVEGLGGFKLYNGVSAEVSAVELTLGDKFLMAGLWFELARGQRDS